MDCPMDVLRLFPVRKSKKQKTAFLETVQFYGQSLGYQTQIENGSFGVRNLVMGNPVEAKYLITAHYDTCARLPFPNLLIPCNLGLFLAWQLFLVVVLCVPAGILGGFIAALIGLTDLVVPMAYVFLYVELVLMLIGPANPRNANDNTSGVVAVLETAHSLPKELQDQVCFVLFDLEEAGLLGSSSYRKKHRKETSRQIVLNLDCIGDGDEILLFPTGKLKKNRARLDCFEAHCRSANGKSIKLIRSGFAVYPSDQSNFPLGLGVAAFRRSSWAGLYLGKIHTKRDTQLDEYNVAMIRDYLLDVVLGQA